MWPWENSRKLSGQVYFAHDVTMPLPWISAYWKSNCRNSFQENKSYVTSEEIYVITLLMKPKFWLLINHVLIWMKWNFVMIRLPPDDRLVLCVTPGGSRCVWAMTSLALASYLMMSSECSQASPHISIHPSLKPPQHRHRTHQWHW